ncbi:ATP-binding protein [Fusibacter sp. JL298sf-3]
MGDIVNISLPSKPEYVSVARLTASFIASQMNFDIEAIEDIKLAVGEACNNAVLHSGTDETYEMNIINDEHEMTIEIIDKGKGFEIDAYTAPSIENLQENGMGLFIIQSLMDEVVINTNDSAGTKIVMKKTVE